MAVDGGTINCRSGGSDSNTSDQNGVDWVDKRNLFFLFFFPLMTYFAPPPHGVGPLF